MLYIFVYYIYIYEICQCYNLKLQARSPDCFARFWAVAKASKKPSLLLMVQKSGKLTSWGLVVAISFFTGFQKHPNGGWEWDF